MTTPTCAQLDRRDDPVGLYRLPSATATMTQPRHPQARNLVASSSPPGSRASGPVGLRTAATATPHDAPGISDESHDRALRSADLRSHRRFFGDVRDP